VKADVDNNVDGDLPVPIDRETGLTVEDSVGLECVDASPVQQANTADSVHETGLLNSSVDEGNQHIPDVDSMPSAVLQASGEFMCSSCGEKTKCARAIKRHMSTHMTEQLLEPSITRCLENADVSVMQKCPKKQDGDYKRLPRPVNKKDSRKQWRRYVCKDCENVFTSSALLDMHRVQTHRPHECQKCWKVMIGRRNFSQHVRSEHPGLHIYKVPVQYFQLRPLLSFIYVSILWEQYWYFHHQAIFTAHKAHHSLQCRVLYYYCSNDAFSEPTSKKLNEDRRILSVAKM